jgi:glycosyltransferase involved in cell wall biosynthesis
LKERSRRRLKLSDISQSRLKRFLADMGRNPEVSLPSGAPSTLAIVVPCYRHEAYLPEMLASIEAQTRFPDEVIFVDDCSPDATGEALKAFVAAHSGSDGRRFTLLANERNQGQAASLNRAISAASTDLIMILNDDDYLMHDAVESLLALFGEYRDVALIGSMNVAFSGREALAAASKLSTAYAAPETPLRLHRPADVPGYRHRNDLDMTHSGSCFYKAAWEAVGGYRSGKNERVVPYSDRDFQLRVNAVWPVAVADKRPFAFWRNDSSVDKKLNS